MQLRCLTIDHGSQPNHDSVCTTWTVNGDDGDDLEIVLQTGAVPDLSLAEAGQLYAWGVSAVLGPFLFVFAGMVVVRGIRRFFGG